MAPGKKANIGDLAIGAVLLTILVAAYLIATHTGGGAKSLIISLRSPTRPIRQKANPR